VKVVDFHTHIFPEGIASRAVEQLENHYQLQIKNNGTFDNFMNKFKEAELYKAVVHAAAVVPRQVPTVNDWLLKIKDENLVNFGTIHPEYEDIEGELTRLKEAGVGGLKLHPDFQKFDIISKEAYAIYEAIGADFLVLFHVGDQVEEPANNYSTPQKLAQVIADFPELRVIAAHLGGYQMWQEAKEYLIGEDIYIDTSSALDFLPEEVVVEIINTHGVDKVLFGSDFPIKDPLTEMRQLTDLGLDLVDRLKILSKNGLKLLEELGVE